MKNKVLIWVAIGIIIIIGIFIFSANLKNLGDRQSGNLSMSNDQVPAWMNIELNNVKTGKAFKISDFKGKFVLLESFAVWCPTCTKQQNEIKKLHEEVGDSIISISLDTDPNEDESKILNHIEEKGFNWYYAVSPIEMTQSLISEFGNGIISAPSAPMILVCDDLSYRKLGGFSVRDSTKLKEEIKRGC